MTRTPTLDAMETLKSYPNLEAIVAGRVAGPVGEWPALRAELVSLCAFFSEERRLRENAAGAATECMDALEDAVRATGANPEGWSAEDCADALKSQVVYAVSLSEAASRMLTHARDYVEAGFEAMPDVESRQLVQAMTEMVDALAKNPNPAGASVPDAARRSATEVGGAGTVLHETVREWVTIRNRMPEPWAPVEIEFSDCEIRRARWTGEVWDYPEPYNRTGIVQWRYLGERTQSGRYFVAVETNYYHNPAGRTTVVGVAESVEGAIAIFDAERGKDEDYRREPWDMDTWSKRVSYDGAVLDHKVLSFPRGCVLQVGTAPAEEELQIVGYRYFRWSHFHPGQSVIDYDCDEKNGSRPWGSQPIYVRDSEAPQPPPTTSRTVAGKES